MAVIDWWNGPLTLVVIFFALCLLLLTWSIACVACRACHSSGTPFFFVTHTYTQVHPQTQVTHWVSLLPSHPLFLWLERLLFNPFLFPFFVIRFISPWLTHTCQQLEPLTADHCHVSSLVVLFHQSGDCRSRLHSHGYRHATESMY